MMIISTEIFTFLASFVSCANRKNIPVVIAMWNEYGNGSSSMDAHSAHPQIVQNSYRFGQWQIRDRRPSKRIPICDTCVSSVGFSAVACLTHVPYIINFYLQRPNGRCRRCAHTLRAATCIALVHVRQISAAVTTHQYRRLLGPFNIREQSN